jgi:hypothetical protein
MKGRVYVKGWIFKSTTKDTKEHQGRQEFFAVPPFPGSNEPRHRGADILSENKLLTF